MSERKEQDDPAWDRMTDPGIFIIGDDVIYDGEAERYGAKPRSKAPAMPKSDDDETTDDAAR